MSDVNTTPNNGDPQPNPATTRAQFNTDATTMVNDAFQTLDRRLAMLDELMRRFDDHQLTHPGDPLRLADMSVPTFVRVETTHVENQRRLDAATSVELTECSGCGQLRLCAEMSRRHHATGLHLFAIDDGQDLFAMDNYGTCGSYNILKIDEGGDDESESDDDVVEEEDSTLDEL